MNYIANSFSLQMLDTSAKSASVSLSEISEAEFNKVVATENFASAVGHPDAAKVLGVPMNRSNILITDHDTLLVAQLQGGRLPEGATTLPEGFKFRYLKITVSY